METQTTILISMPWAELHYPSIQLGTLQSICRRRTGYDIIPLSVYLDFMEFLLEKSELARVDGPETLIEDYQTIAGKRWRCGLGDWIFAVRPYLSINRERDAAYFEYLEQWGLTKAEISKAQLIRNVVPEFLDRTANRVLQMRPKIVGFTSTFSQNISSLVLAKILKARDPSIVTVLGGGNCDGPMGEALHRSFSWIDVVVRGEADEVFPALVQSILEGRGITPLPGICWRDSSGLSRTEPLSSARVNLSDVPAPDYDEFFRKLEGSKFAAQVSARVELPFESARGCWWGEKAHCTFCGLNGSAMTFRSKSADQVLEEIKYLTSRHKRLSLCAVDNIIDFRYFDNLLPRLRALRMSGVDLSLFYETKANLKRDQLLLMREAGILAIQPGIESLSTPILRLMRKGVTALQNIRLLKWSAELGIRVIWNLLYGIPREPPEEYQRMASVIPSLTHLTPPAITPVVVDRFSPYHSQPREFGLNVTGPASWYPLCYQVEKKVLDDLAYEFSHIYEDSRNPVDYVRPVAKAVRSWKAANMAGSALVYESGLDFLRIHEGRPNFSPRIYTLEKGEALAYAACDSGATTAHLQRVLKDNGFEMPLNEVTAFLQDLVDAKLVAVENGTYLSLAVRVNRHIPSREGVVPPQD